MVVPNTLLLDRETRCECRYADLALVLAFSSPLCVFGWVSNIKACSVSDRLKSPKDGIHKT